MLDHHKAKLVTLEMKHSKLNQIDMLSGEGAQLRREVHETEGIIKALFWVKDDRIMDI